MVGDRTSVINEGRRSSSLYSLTASSLAWPAPTVVMLLKKSTASPPPSACPPRNMDVEGGVGMDGEEEKNDVEEKPEEDAALLSVLEKETAGGCCVALSE